MEKRRGSVARSEERGAARRFLAVRGQGERAKASRAFMRGYEGIFRMNSISPRLTEVVEHPIVIPTRLWDSTVAHSTHQPLQRLIGPHTIV